MRILAVKTHAAGDLLLASPALRALRKGLRDAEIILLTGRANAEIAAALPGIPAYMLVEEEDLLRRRPRAAYELFRKVRAIHAERAVIFQPSPHLARVLALTGTPVFAPTAAVHPPKWLAGSVPWVPNADRYIAATYVALAEKAGGVADGLELDFVIPEKTPPAREIAAFSDKKAYVVVAPAGGRNPREEVEAKLPPVAFFAAVVNLIAQETERPIVLIGGPRDGERCRAVAAAAAFPIVNLAARTTLAESARVIRDAAYFVTVDSLPLHVAVALGVPTLALFGPSNPRALLPPESCVTAVQSETPCAPCYANMPFPPCPRRPRYECREHFPVAAVEQFVLRMENELGKPGNRRPRQGEVS
jgi:ADP-heptose:LPS heptosyltransferase